MDYYDERAAQEADEYFHQLEREKLVEQLRDVAEKIRRCDYTQARSDLLMIIANYE